MLTMNDLLPWVLAAAVVGGLLGAIGAWMLCERALTNLRTALATAQERCAGLGRDGERFGEMMSGQFAELAQRALDGASKNLVELASAKLGEERVAVHAVVSPLQREFAKFSQAVDALRQNSAHDLGGLKESIAQVTRLQGTLHEAVRTTNDATGRLQTALQNPRVAGNWGELSLDRVVALAGMTEHCDFEKQAGTRSAEGTLEKPDLTVNLTGGLKIPIDAKASTANYIRAFGESDELERKRLIDQSVRDLKGRVTELRGRGYDRIAGYAGMTVLYVPNESMLSSALAQEPALIEDALRYGIVICSPLLLLCYLRAFAHGWSLQKQRDNAEEVARRGKMLHDRLLGFFGALSKLGERLHRTVDIYNDCVGKTDNLLVPAREMSKLLGLNEALPDVPGIGSNVRAIRSEATTANAEVVA